MFDSRQYFRNRNSQVAESYEESLNLIREIHQKTDSGNKEKHQSYFHKVSSLILMTAEIESNISDDYFEDTPFETLRADNINLFGELIGDNYEQCFANPAYPVSLFENEIGQLFAALYINFRRYIEYAFLHKTYKMEALNQVFIDLFELFETGTTDYDQARAIATRTERDVSLEDLKLDVKTSFDKNLDFYTHIVNECDLTDLRYLFRYGVYVSENEIKTAKFLRDYPEHKIKKLSNLITHAYLKGFEIEGKDVSKKTTVNVMYAIGQERIIRQLIIDLRKKNLDVLINYLNTTNPNKQVGYDHRFDRALYFSEAYSHRFLNLYEEAHLNCRDISSEYSGIIICDKFGEAAFAPEKKEECLRFTPEQQTLFQKHESKFLMLRDKFVPFSETSFSMIAFPSPEIGVDFEAIFEDIMEVNMLDTEIYETIQQKMVDALDQAEFVHVKGKGDNLTDIIVKMQPLADPDAQTNFYNCGADENIPVGEVFTSPQLKGTTGILHIEETYLRGLKFVDLKLIFEDGYIRKYSCANFESEEDSRKYVHENLIFPNETLPIGEFAIGTNTLAYVVARKYNILDIMPILIVEKMGPHFAVGDTCYTRQEDKKIYNITNRKEILSRDNEKTALRKTDVNQAYTNTHTDITLPYDTIEFISVVKPGGEHIDIIRNGRFVLTGTEELNAPFDR